MDAPDPIFFSTLHQQAKQKLSRGLGRETHLDEFFFQAGPLTLDVTRQVFDEDMLNTCIDQAVSAGLEQKLKALFTGKKVNHTEDRAALHWLLRAKEQDIDPQILTEFNDIQVTLKAMAKFSLSVIEGAYTAAPDTAITDVVNLGVGGSDLGPRLAYDALKDCHNALNIHFVANIDGNDLMDTLSGLSPASTLFVVTSKTFSTLETLENAKAAEQWLKRNGIQNTGAHFAAASSRPDRAAEFGIEPSRVFPMWDWVGGRYSLLSSVGLSLMLGIGPDNFDCIRDGAREIDLHVKQTPLKNNAGFIQACVGIISINGLDVHNHGIIGYDSRLELLPAYLQQLEMESNGKSVNNSGDSLTYAACPVIWGGVGTNTQHSFHQLLHQGTVKSNIEFLLPLGEDHGLPIHQAYLQANCLAQADALVHGKSLEQVRKELKDQPQEVIDAVSPHKVIQGNKPCSIIGYQTLTPQVLGALISLYEHKVYIQAQLWNINPYDQWGVELGKQLCEPIFQSIQGKEKASDPRTQRWVELIQQIKA